MNTITIVDFLNISIHNTKIIHGFLKYYETSQYLSAFQEIFVDKLAHIYSIQIHIELLFR